MTDTLTKDQRRIKYLEKELLCLSENFVKYTEANDSTLSDLVDHVTNGSINSIASLQAVQQDMISRLMIMVEIALAAVPSDRMDAVMLEARLKLSSLPGTDILAQKFKAEIIAEHDSGIGKPG